MTSIVKRPARMASKGKMARGIVSRAPDRMAMLRMKAIPPAINRALKRGSKGETDSKALAKDILNDQGKGNGMDSHNK
jgi:hypothetical protein